METAHKVDKSKWPVGPWSTEPDKLEWRDAETGLPCLLLRPSSTGMLCGYVGVPPGHKAHKVHYGDDALYAVTVHGGLTFAGNRESDEPKDAWWLGFDCAHSDDLSPWSRSPSRGTYRDVPYVQAECRSLARQLAKLGGR